MDGYLKQNPFGDMEIIFNGGVHFVAHDGCCMRCGGQQHDNRLPPATRQAIADALDTSRKELVEVAEMAWELAADIAKEARWHPSLEMIMHRHTALLGRLRTVLTYHR